MDGVLPLVIVLFYSVIRVYLTPVVLRGEMMMNMQNDNCIPSSVTPTGEHFQE